MKINQDHRFGKVQDGKVLNEENGETYDIVTDPVEAATRLLKGEKIAVEVSGLNPQQLHTFKTLMEQTLAALAGGDVYIVDQNQRTADC